MATSPNQQRSFPRSTRNIALCVAKWANGSTVLTWAWLRSYFLSHDTDRLFILHTGKDESWKIGGPLIPDLDTSLKTWPHSIVSVSGSLQANLSGFLERHAIDIVVVPEDFPRQGAVQIGSVADWVKQNVRIPFVLIRPGAVRNERLKLTSGPSLSVRERTQSSLSSTGPTTTTPQGRKIAIAYPSFSVGVRLMELSKRRVLLAEDEIYIVHCFPQGGSQWKEGGQKALRQTKKVFRSLSLALPGTAGGGGGGGGSRTDSGSASPVANRNGAEGGSPLASELTEEITASFGAKELEEFPNLRLNVVLRGDPRHELTSFCESENIELLIISTRTGGRILKTLSGGSVSAYLIDKAPCPCLVVPYKALGLTTEQEEGEEVLTPLGSSTVEIDWPTAGDEGLRAVGPVAGSIADPAGASYTQSLKNPTPAAMAALQAQLDQKNAEIAALKAEVERLRLEAAAARDEQTHDPTAARNTY